MTFSASMCAHEQMGSRQFESVLLITITFWVIALWLMVCEMVIWQMGEILLIDRSFAYTISDASMFYVIPLLFQAIDSLWPNENFSFSENRITAY